MKVEVVEDYFKILPQNLSRGPEIYHGNLGQNIRSQDRKLIPSSPEYEAGVIATPLQCSVLAGILLKCVLETLIIIMGSGFS
jgi:hypothetical protein